jgi:uncharacterized protein (DUF58 family)
MRLAWRLSPPARGAAVLVAMTVTAALMTGRGELMALAVPGLLWLTASLRAPRPATTTIQAHLDPPRAPEGGDVALTLSVPDDGLEYRGELLRGWYEIRHVDATAWRLRMPVWGRHPVRVAVHISTAGGAWRAVVRFAVTVEVTPRGMPGTAALRGRVRRPSYGERAARVPGAGTEFLDVAEWTPGMALRRLHWAATLRTGHMHVARMAADRNQDVLLVVDARTEAGPLGSSTVDRAVRAAVALADAHLRAGDRVALAVAGERLRWVAPGSGTRHLVRMIDCLLDHRTGDAARRADIDRIPARILVPGALTICLTAMLSDESLRLIGDVRRRGHPTVVVDVLDREPPARRRVGEQQALRTWRLSRVAIRQHLSRRGIVAVSWPADASLAATLRPLAVRPIGAGR